MITFKQFLLEKVLSPGFNPEHNEHREKYRDQIHDILKTSYEKMGGYGGLGSGTEQEHNSIHADITKLNIKMTRRGDAITAVMLYKDQFGRKAVAAGTDGSVRGKKDLLAHMKEDHTQSRSWGEVSDTPEHLQRKLGAPEVPYAKAKKIIGKDDMEQIPGTNRYERKIGDKIKGKIAMGHPKLD